MIENKAQISGEYLLLAGVLILVLMVSAVFIFNEQELNIAMTAARNGVNSGLADSSSAIYAKEAYDEYSISKSNLLMPYSVEIVNISYSEMGMDDNYDKEWIQFKVYAKSSKDFSKEELDSVGDRINYHLRKALAISFNSTASTNNLYNPVFSNHYVFTTANVIWV